MVEKHSIQRNSHWDKDLKQLSEEVNQKIYVQSFLMSLATVPAT